MAVSYKKRILCYNYSESILPEVILEWEYHTNVSGNY